MVELLIERFAQVSEEGRDPRAAITPLRVQPLVHVQVIACRQRHQITPLDGGSESRVVGEPFQPESVGLRVLKYEGLASRWKRPVRFGLGFVFVTWWVG